MDFCKRIAGIDKLWRFWLHRLHEMAGPAFARCSSVLVHHSGQPARPLQPGACTWHNGPGHKNNDRHDQAQHRRRGRAVALLNRASVLAEGQVRLDAGHIGIIYARRFAELASAFRIFGRKQMPAGGLRPQHLAARRDFETFCD